MATKTVYNSADGGAIEAHEDQVTAGLYHLPAGATEVKPPSFVADSQTCQFIGNTWVVADIPVAESEAESMPKLVTYAEKRQAEYPAIGDQLDQLMKDMRDGTTTHKDACEAVKAKYPKP